ncbi:19210_t:CDS:2, partial [Gigaspora margarita]
LDLKEYEFDDIYVGSLDEGLDEYDENQIISDAQEIQALESSNMLIQKISNVIQENQASIPKEIQLIVQSPNDTIVMSDSTTKDI